MRRKSFQIVVVLMLFLAFSCTNNKEKLIIFHAGSLSVPFKEISKDFMTENPNVEILSESAGSRKCARKITDLNRECDIMASADYTVIDNLLIPDFADWNIKFASNEMAIVYNDKSRLSDKINEDNWYDILMDENVAFGRSNPDADPCGYRAVLTMKLSEKYYKKDSLVEKMLLKDLNYIRSKEVDLLALLESNNIDYIFLYRSVAEQHHLNYLLLSDSINLKNSNLTDYYSNVTCDVSGKKPGETITKKGAPMVYGITIPNNAPNKELAEKFIAFVLEKENGMAIMEKNGQPSLIPTYSETFDAIPNNLQKFALKN